MNVMPTPKPLIGQQRMRNILQAYYARLALIKLNALMRSKIVLPHAFPALVAINPVLCKPHLANPAFIAMVERFLFKAYEAHHMALIAVIAA